LLCDDHAGDHGLDNNLPASEERYASLAGACGVATDDLSMEAAARRAIDYIRRLNAELDIPPFGRLIDERDLDLLAAKAAANTSAPSNPRRLSRQGERSSARLPPTARSLLAFRRIASCDRAGDDWMAPPRRRRSCSARATRRAIGPTM